MKKECGKCKGKGGREVRNGRKPGWFETGRDWIRCDVCGGSGVNPKYRESSCAYCHFGKVTYSSDNPNPPLYCSESCKQGARREADAKRKAEQQNRHTYHDSRRDERKNDRPSYGNPGRNSEWLEKYCPGVPGNYCGNTIRYKASWDNPPTHCDTCKNREFEKPCANSIYGCDRKVKFKVTWKDIPTLCGRCRKEAEGGSTPRRCDSCNKILFNRSGKSFTTCRECNEKKQVEAHEALRRSVQGRRISAYASSMPQFAQSLISYISSSDDIFFVELGGEARKAWKLPPMVRGEAVDKGFDRGKLPYNFPTIDLWDAGTATSIKSIDLGAESYRNLNALDRQVANYIDQVARYEGTQGREYGGTRITEDEVRERSLILVAPLITSREYQINHLYSLKNGYAQQKGVKLVIFIVD